MCVTWNNMGNVICQWSTPFEIVLIPNIVVCKYTCNMCIIVCVRWKKCVYGPPNTYISCELKREEQYRSIMVVSLSLSPQFWCLQKRCACCGYHSLHSANYHTLTNTNHKYQPQPSLPFTFWDSFSTLANGLTYLFYSSCQNNVRASLFHSISFLCNHNEINFRTLHCNVNVLT